MKPLHWTVHVLPASATAGETLEVEGREIQTIAAAQSALCAPFPVTFEEVLEQFETLPRMFAEPDGSFVWRGLGPSDEWQLDGQLYDRNGHLLYVELNGTINEESLDSLLQSFAGPETPLAFQLMRTAILLDEAGFRRLLFN